MLSSFNQGYRQILGMICCIQLNCINFRHKYCTTNAELRVSLWKKSIQKYRRSHKEKHCKNVVFHTVATDVTTKMFIWKFDNRGVYKNKNLLSVPSAHSCGWLISEHLKRFNFCVYASTTQIMLIWFNVLLLCAVEMKIPNTSYVGI